MARFRSIGWVIFLGLTTWGALQLLGGVPAARRAPEEERTPPGEPLQEDGVSRMPPFWSPRGCSSLLDRDLDTLRRVLEKPEQVKAGAKLRRTFATSVVFPNTEAEAEKLQGFAVLGVATFSNDLLALEKPTLQVIFNGVGTTQKELFLLPSIFPRDARYRMSTSGASGAPQLYRMENYYFIPLSFLLRKGTVEVQFRTASQQSAVEVMKLPVVGEQVRILRGGLSRFLAENNPSPETPPDPDLTMGLIRSHFCFGF